MKKFNFHPRQEECCGLTCFPDISSNFMEPVSASAKDGECVSTHSDYLSVGCLEFSLLSPRKIDSSGH